jgi:hypothetical protein
MLGPAEPENTWQLSIVYKPALNPNKKKARERSVGRVDATLPTMGRIGCSVSADKFDFESTSESVGPAIMLGLSCTFFLL